jgi:serine/threonine protein kinase
MSAPRAAGVRIGYPDVPERVRDWVEDRLGAPVTDAAEQVGGMSPGCATRLRAANAVRAFVKAVGPELNPMTPDLFRHEATVLGHLGGSASWARLREVYDEPDGWVALLLEDIEGGHPDLADPAHRELVLAGTGALTAELAGRAEGLEIDTWRQGLERWAAAFEDLDALPDELLPDWLRKDAGAFDARIRDLARAADGDALVHGDIRNDNLLLSGDGRLVFVDWGMSRRGASWVDPLIVRLEWADQPLFDALVAGSPALQDLGEEPVTTFLVGIGVWLAYRSTMPPAPGLPTMNAFRRAEAARFLAGAARRLGH